MFSLAHIYSSTNRTNLRWTHIWDEASQVQSQNLPNFSACVLLQLQTLQSSSVCLQILAETSYSCNNTSWVIYCFNKPLVIIFILVFLCSFISFCGSCLSSCAFGMMFPLGAKALPQPHGKEGGWACFSKYIEENWFKCFLRIQWINRYHLATITSWPSLKATIARWHLLVRCMLRK